jgi:hypothetical protein
MLMPTVVDDIVKRDLKTLATFITIYCQHQHPDAEKNLITMPQHDITAIAGKEIHLCGECRKLLLHAFVKRCNCPLDPKPMCKHCPVHCYAASYRAKIQEVMRFSGKKIVMGGRIDQLLHLLT